MEQVMLWPPNTLPVPFGDLFNEGNDTHQPEILVDDNFPKGRISKYFPNQRYGFIKDRVGREICFKISEMDFIGSKGEDSLREGIAVGYDLSYSGTSLHVKGMKIY